MRFVVPLLLASLVATCGRNGFEGLQPDVLPDELAPEPSIEVTTPAPLAGGSVASLEFLATLIADGTTDYTLDVLLDAGAAWLPLGTVPGVAGDLRATPFTFLWSPVPLWNSAQVQLRVSTRDLDGHEVVAVSAPFVVDSSPPAFESGSFLVNSGSVATSRRVQRLSITSTDALTNVQGLCFRYTTPATPAPHDPCWVDVSAPSVGLAPAPVLVLLDYPFPVPPVGGLYTFYAWARDSVGNASLLSGAGLGTPGVDVATALYTPNPPAQFLDLSATSTDTPSAVFSESDLTAPLGANVVIKWRLLDDAPLPGQGVSLSYTTDEVSFTPIVGQLDNTVNGACSLGASHTGCFSWVGGSPSSSYFRVRVSAVDADGNVSTSTSQPLNVAGTFRVLAGNTDPGTGGTASAAMFINALTAAATYSDPQSFVVATDGTLYFRDATRGILAVPPETGVQELLIRTTGTATGDGGPVTSATLALPSKLILDHAGNLLVYDRTRIRKIDLFQTPPTIDTLIGGGASKADAVPPREVQMDDFASLTSHLAMSKPFFTTPNGDVFFSSEASSRGAAFRLRRLSAASGLVHSLSLTGPGHTGGAEDTTLCEKLDVGVTFDVATSALTSLTALSFVEGYAGCSFSNYLFASTNYDPTTGVASAPHPALITGNGNSNRATRRFTAHDGNHYVVAREKATIWRYDEATRDVVRLVGTGTSGMCADGTLALDCAIDPFDAYVSPQGVLYFVDRGAIRIVHTDGRVYTVMGQRYNFGDGGAATSARLGQLLDFDVWSSAGTPMVVLYDGTERQMREFAVGGAIQHVAGNGVVGVPVLGELAVATPLINRGTPTDDFAVDAGGSVYYIDGDQVVRLDRATGRWQPYLGVDSGGVSYLSGDGLSGATQVNLVPGSRSASPAVVAATPTRLFVRVGSWDGDAEFVKSYDHATRTQSAAMGLVTAPDPGSAWCGNGLTATTCRPPGAGYSAYDHDGVGNRLVINSQDSGLTFGFVPLNGTDPTTSVVVTGSAPMGRKFDHFRNAADTRELLYYCDVVGRLMKVDLRNSNTRTTITVPATITCASGGVAYDEVRNSLLFVFRQNGLTGVGERLNP